MDMNPTVIDTIRSQIIDRIKLRYEQLRGSRPDDERLPAIHILSLKYLKKLADRLDQATPGAEEYGQWPSSIVLSVIAEYEQECWG
jgi:hypothetical protein